MLRVSNLHSYYGRSHVLKGVSLDVPESQVVAILGRNGMGKTTLVSSIMGFRPPDVREGEVLLGDEPLTRLSTPDIARRGLAVVPQGRRNFGSLTVAENLDVAERGGQYKREGLAWTRDDVHELFPVLAERSRQRARSLSGGERAMLAIARALLARPRLLIMDEPSEGLAPVIVERLEESFSAMKASGLTILVVEQNIHIVRTMADRILIVDRGAVALELDQAQFEARWGEVRKFMGI